MFKRKPYFMRALVLVLGLLGANTPAAHADNGSCEPDSQTMVTISGTIRLLRTIITPLKHPDGSKDYSIVDSVDEYELSLHNWSCSAAPVLVRFRYGHAKPVSCKDNTPATVTGFYTSGREGEPAYIYVLSPAGLNCATP